jgi:hypothetical protein
MRIATSWSTAQGSQAIDEAYSALVTQLGTAPSLLIMHCSVAYDSEEILTALARRVPGMPMQGGTSCLGVMTEAGMHSAHGRGLALFGMHDPEGAFGVGAADKGENPRAAAQQAMQAALEHAGRPGELPAMVWLTASPGSEEALLAGIADVIGNDVPVAGGSSADDSVSGQWQQFANCRAYNHAVVVTALFPSTEVLFAFHSGYEPTPIHGTVTRAEGRVLLEIDGHPAAQVYNRWTDGLVDSALQRGGNILALTTLHPLGRVAGYVGKIPYYQLSHPDAITATGGLTLFTDIAVGEELVLMRGTTDSLVTRAGRVAVSAMEAYGAAREDVAGALVVYCAGCMLTVRERMDEVVRSLRVALPGTPFLGEFTFGEQGCFVGGENRHGNLMISVLLFRR